jgi:hypothetical protein
VKNLSGGQKSLHIITDVWSSQYKKVPSEHFILDNRHHKKDIKKRERKLMKKLDPVEVQ